MIRTIHAGRVVDRVGANPHAGQRCLDTPELGGAEVAAFSDHLAAQLVAVDADGVGGFVANFTVRLCTCFDVGTDTAVVKQIDRRFENRPHQLDRRHRRHGGINTQCGFGFRRQLDRFRAAREQSAAFGDQRLVVVVPRRARQGKHARALFETVGGVRIWVEENMPMIECRDQADVFGQQHAVAKHVARHVPYASDGEVGGLRVDADFAEVAFDTLPRTARGDAHFLVVIAGRAARGERVAEPVAVFGRNAVGVIRERRRALVCGHHQIGIIGIVTYDIVRRDHLALD